MNAIIDVRIIACVTIVLFQTLITCAFAEQGVMKTSFGTAPDGQLVDLSEFSSDN